MTTEYEHEDAPALDNSDQLSAGWLTAALLHCGVLQGEERVAAVHAEAFAVGVAMLSDLCRVSPLYEPASIAERPGVPSSLVVKFAASTDAKQITISYGGYQQEIRFYREIAPKIDGVRLGPCLYTAMSPPEQRYTLVFDDLATDATLCVAKRAYTPDRCQTQRADPPPLLSLNLMLSMRVQHPGGPGHWVQRGAGDSCRALLRAAACCVLGVPSAVRCATERSRWRSVHQR